MQLCSPRQVFPLACALLVLTACGGPALPTASPSLGGPTSAERAPTGDRVTVGDGNLPPMPVAVTSFGAAVQQGYAYVLGGYHGAPHDYHRAGQSRAFLRLPLDGGAWERIDELEQGIQGVALVALDGRVCRLGGNRVLNAQGEPVQLRSLAEAACYDPTTRSWRSLPSLPEARSSHEAAVIGDTAYVAGGWRIGGGGPSRAAWADDLLVLRSGEGAWRRIPAPFQRRAVGVASAGGKLVVIGGLTPEREVSARVDVYDPETAAWSAGPEFPADAFGVSAVGVGDAVYASGRDGVVYRHRLGEDGWTEAGTLIFPRFFHQLVSAGSSLVALGGIGGMHTNGRTRITERLLLGRQGEGRLLTVTLPYPGRAKNRQASFLHDDFVYLFGGNNSLGQHDFAPDNFVADGWRFHLPSLRWAETSAYPARRQTMQTVTREAGGIAVGVCGHDGTAAVTQPEAFAFDFASETWSARGGLPRGRTQFGLVEQGEHLWVFGGLNFDPARSGPAAFEHETGTLRAPAGRPEAAFAPTDVELPEPRRAFAGARLGDRYVLVGGMREGFQLVDSCVAFAFDSRTFTSIACPRRTRLSAHLLALDGRLVLVGGSYRGEDGMESDRSVEVYDPEADRWHVALEALPFDTRHAHVMPYRGRVLVLSTHNDEGLVRLAFVDLGRPG
ncbi:MAG: hypothetical protein ACFCGT_02295 [Sandaracinaceae bacterium]